VLTATTDEFRDRLTRRHLAAVEVAPEPTEIRRFQRGWWDGGVRVPSLIVRLRGHGRARLVETGGQVVALPVSGWRARRAIRRMRRRAVVDPRLLAFAADPSAHVETRLPLVRQRSDAPRGRPTMPRQRTDLPRLVVHIEQETDVVRCSAPDCAALVEIPPPGRLVTDSACPRCGRVELPAQQTSPLMTALTVLS
jgi:hypothetical protein